MSAALWWAVLVVCAIALPLECRRFYRLASNAVLSWWVVLDIVASITLIVMAALHLGGRS